MNKNPFILRGMIKSRKSFWGRETEIRSLYSCLLDSEDQPQSVALVGQRKIGKSSLLYRIFQKDLADEIYFDQLQRTIVVMISMQGLTTATQDQFFERLLDDLRASNSPFNDLIDELRTQNIGNNEKSFERVLRLMDKDKFLLAILLDEFETAAINRNFDKPFFDKLRSLAQERRLAYIVSVHHDLDKLWDISLTSSPYSSPFFNIFQTLTLKGFSKCESLAYIQKASKEAGQLFDEDEVSIIDEFGGTHPFFINLAAYHVFEGVNRNGRKRNIENIRGDILSDPALYGNFRYFWKNLTDQQQMVLIEIADQRLNYPLSREQRVDIDWMERMHLVQSTPEGECLPFCKAFSSFLIDLSNERFTKIKGNSIHAREDISEIISKDESAQLEYKSSLRWDFKTSEVADYIQLATLKTIAAFLNTYGGSLIIGIDDDGLPLGLEYDYKTLKKPNKDGFELHLINLIKSNLRKELCRLININFHLVADKEICRVVVAQSPEPVYCGKEKKFYIRTGNSTDELSSPEEVIRYFSSHWK